MAQPFLALSDDVWIEVKDGDTTGMALFLRHYTAKPTRKQFQFVGPGGKLVLLTPDARALFVWRLFKSDAGESGINCAVFRNEGSSAGRSSDLIRAAVPFAWRRWPEQRRIYTYVDDSKIRHKRDPGRCFLRAGFKYCRNADGSIRRSGSGKIVLDFERTEGDLSVERWASRLSFLKAS